MVRSLGQEDPLEKEMAIHSSILAWEIPQTEEPGRLQYTGSQKSQTQLSNSTTTTTVFCNVVSFLLIALKDKDRQSCFG